MRLKQPDETTRWVRLSSSIDYDQAGTPRRVKCALIIDDDADSLELLGMVLKRAGATVTQVMSASSALQQSGTFNVIVSAIGMPEMDGYALIRRIRASEQWASVPAIALTAYARGEDSKLALQAGYQEHLVKPLDATALIERVKKLTGAG